MHTTGYPHEDTQPTILLVGGHWLGAWAWQQTIAQLTTHELVSRAITLPGLDPADPQRLERTLTDQVRALSEVLLGNAQPATIVAHSGANAPVTQLIDQHPEHISRIIWVDSGPVAPNTVFADGLPAELTELPLPDFDTLAQQASTASLTTDALAHFRAHAVSQPTLVLRVAVTLTNPARYDVPTSFVCCSYPSAQVQQLVAAEHPMFAETAHYRDVEYVDLPTGHWPMWSEPHALAALIAERA